MQLNIKLDEGATFSKKHKHDTGFDVSIVKFISTDRKPIDCESYVLHPFERISIDTGVSAEWDKLKEYYWEFVTGAYCSLNEFSEHFNIDTQIRPRSGLTLSDGVMAALGTIDEQYRGNICVTLFNLSDKCIELKVGERIGQVVIGLALNPDLNIVSELSRTERGDKGFGSSGK